MPRAIARFSWMIVTLLAWTGTGWAQSPDHGAAMRLLMTRAELEELIAAYNRSAGSNPARPDLQALARQEIELIRSRLADGDFQTGDQIALRVQGEAQLTGNFAVVAGREGASLRLPLIGDIPLKGVLRSEVESHLRTQIGRFIRDPVVYAEATIRISVLQGVERPGFYPVAAEQLLTDVLMTAGGPSQRAKLDEIRIERGKEKIWTGAELQRAITEGRTLDQLSLRAGDRIIIPERSDRPWIGVLQASAVVIPAVFALVRIF